MPQAAPIPIDEDLRLAALRRYEVIDTERELAFDRITALAGRIFDMPISLVSLIDAERQWFKSCLGLDAVETDRDLAFCAHAILSREPLVIRDALEDVRFADNPFVTGDPFVRFYAGAPLISAEGFALGTLCLIDKRPRDLDESQLKTLIDLAAMVVDELELRKARRQVEQQMKALGEAVLQSERHRTELARQTTILRNVFDSVGEGLVVADENGTFRFFNGAAERILGMGAREITQREWASEYGVFETDETTPFPAEQLPLARALRGDSTDRVELFIRNPALPQGAFISITGRPMRDAQGALAGGVVTFNDITELRKARAELARLATTDPLTGLPNKRVLAERLGLLVAEASRGRRFALIIADVDHFKKVNDTHGHDVGDKTLKAVAKVFQSRLRKTDLVSRFGGEEFCILLVDVDREMAEKVAEELREMVARIEKPVQITSSFGVCWADGMRDVDGAAMIKGADEALYKAKSGGRNKVIVAEEIPALAAPSSAAASNRGPNSFTRAGLRSK